jgi:hypothetical protein
MLERAPMLALIFNVPKDADLLKCLQELLSKWISFNNAPAPQYKGDDYEMQHAAYSMKYLAKLYGKQFMDDFYVPCFMNFI